MPIYEYRCLDCNEMTEVIQRAGSGPLRKCKNCSGRLEKLVSRTAFHLKGGGWFSEGYTNSDGKKKEKSAGTSESSSSSPPAKPEPKSKASSS